jgi:RNA polymerase sigma-70 factor (ECF subfamily)
MNKAAFNFKSNKGGMPLTTLQKAAKADKSAIKDCVDVYGNLVWALAKKFTSSQEEAEEAALKIFTEIWQYAPNFDSAKCTEEHYVLKIAFRHLIKQSTFKH